MSTQKSHCALNAHLNLLTTFTGAIAWENNSFKPQTDQTFIRPTFMPGESRQVNLGTTRIERQTGVYQIDIFIPAGEGTGKAEDIATQIVQAFTTGLKLSFQDIQLTITKSYQAKGGNSESWYILPVKIHWQADF